MFGQYGLTHITEWNQMKIGIGCGWNLSWLAINSIRGTCGKAMVVITYLTKNTRTNHVGPCNKAMPVLTGTNHVGPCNKAMAVFTYLNQIRPSIMMSGQTVTDWLLYNNHLQMEHFSYLSWWILAYIPKDDWHYDKNEWCHLDVRKWHVPNCFREEITIRTNM